MTPGYPERNPRTMLDRNKRRNERRQKEKAFKEVMKLEGRYAHYAPKRRQKDNEYDRIVRHAKIQQRRKSKKQ